MRNWEDIKKHIREDLNSKERITKKVMKLAKPSIRLNALNRIEKLFEEQFPEIISNPASLNEIEKNDFKKRLSKYKLLNGAEDSIVNNIFDLIK